MKKIYKKLIFIAIGAAIIASGVFVAVAVNNRGNAPVAWWKFDEGYGQIVYDAAGSNDGTLATSTEVTTADPTWKNEPECKSGKCLSFDGTNDYVSSGSADSIDVTDQTTIEAWVKTSSATAQSITQKGNNCNVHPDKWFYYDGDQLILRSAENDPDYYISSRVITLHDGVFHHIAVTAIDGQSPKFYLDGVDITNSSSIYHKAASADNWNLLIGAAILTPCGSTSPNTYFFKGFIDDVRIYNYARTAAQIKADYLAGAGGRGGSMKVSSKDEVRNAGEGLAGHWKFDETALNGCGTSTDGCDSSGNLNNLTAIADAAPTSTAKYGYAATFDGTGDYYCTDPDNDGDCDDDDDLDVGTSDITYECWIKTTQSDANWHLIMGKSGTTTPYTGAYFYIRNGKVWGYFNEAATHQLNQGSISVADGVWHHIAYVFDRDGLAVIYVDGVKDPITSNIASYSSSISNNGNFLIGSNSVSQDYSGQIDDVKIYKTARSADQIMLDYETGPPPVAHWRMDEKVSGDAKTIYDTSGSNNGTTVDGANNTGMNCAKPGKYGTACEFDGTDDYVGATATGIKTTAGAYNTVSFWMKWNGIYPWSDTWSVPFGFDTNYILALGSASTGFGFNTLSGDLLYTSSAGFANNWVHVAAVFYNGTPSASNNKIYINGVEKTLSLSGTPTSKNISTTTRIGSANFTYSLAVFGGLIDDVRIYNYARTQKQIYEDMNAGHPAVGSPVGSYVGYWDFNEGYNTTAFDKSNNSKDLTVSAASWTLNGKFGKAFDGGDNKRVADGADDNDLDFEAAENFTLSAWFNRGAISNAEYIIYKENGNEGYALYLDGSGDVIFGIGDTNSASFPEESVGNLAVDYDNSAWHHAVAVKTGTSRIDLYVDGILIASDTSLIVDATLENAGILYIGDANATDGTDEFLGDIDEVKIYPFALTAAEIKQEYNRGASLKLGSIGGPQSSSTSSDAGVLEFCVPGDATSTCNAPVAWWKMDEKTGQYAWDSSGSGNTGTLGTGSSPDSSDPAWKSAGSCKQGGCLWFDGSNDSATGTIVTTTAPYTVTGWAKIDPTYPASRGRYMVCLGAGGTALPCFSPHFYDGNKPLIYLGASNYRYGTLNLNDGKWHHIAFIVTGSAQEDINNAKIYIDGREETYSSTVATGVGNSPTTDFGIGTSQYKGWLDDIKIYNYVRTASQIAWEYNRGKPYARWSMDSVGVSGAPGTSTKVYDESFRNNDGAFEGETAANGTISGATWKRGSNCKYGSCLSFDGSNDYVDVGNSTSSMFADSFTLTAWVYLNNLSASWSTFVSRDNYSTSRNYWFGKRVSSGRLSFHYISGAVNWEVYTTNVVLSQSTWHYAIATVDASRVLRIYLDGQEITDLTGTSTLLAFDDTTGVSVNIGGSGTHAGAYYTDGLIDDVRIYNTALTAAQVLALYQNNDRAAGASLENNLVAEWHLDENSGSYTADTHYLREGKRGYAAKFDGSNDYINLGSFALSNTPEGTFEAWVYKTGNGQIIDNRQFYIVHSGSSLYLDIYTTGGWAQGTGGFPLSLNLPSSQWYHLAVVKQTSTTTDVYVNGVYRTNIAAKTGNLSYSGTPHTIGRYYSGGTYFTGLIDDVRVYNYARTASQLKQDYNEGAAVRFGPASGLP